jgi:hypothetical protein
MGAVDVVPGPKLCASLRWAGSPLGAWELDALPKSMTRRFFLFAYIRHITPLAFIWTVTRMYIWNGKR